MYPICKEHVYWHISVLQYIPVHYLRMLLSLMCEPIWWRSCANWYDSILYWYFDVIQHENCRSWYNVILTLNIMKQIDIIIWWRKLITLFKKKHILAFKTISLNPIYTGLWNNWFLWGNDFTPPLPKRFASREVQNAQKSITLYTHKICIITSKVSYCNCKVLV